jgi:alpha-D-ribose 1-methylphosphonate 5-triphosphate synthase subunit PhnH
MRREVIYDEVFDAQQQFRLILDSMARPGKINTMPDMDILPPAGINKASALVAFALLNTDVSFSVEGEESEEIESYIALNTTADRVSITEADFIFINGWTDTEIIAEAKTGTLSYPENSATFVIDTEAIEETAVEGSIMLTLKGPGIETQKEVYIKGINPDMLKAVLEQNLEFPLGIDLMLTDRSNRILCIPRSNQFLVGYAGAQLTEINN